MSILPSRRSVISATVLAAGTALLAAGALLAGPASAAPPPAGSQYVALGDSYAAGYGIGTSTGQPVAGCAQSTQDYPHQIAAALGLTLTDVTCSGAVTANIDTTPQVTPAGTAPLQDSALSITTKLVTVTIGGNDFGFSSIATYCAAASPTGPLAFHPAEANCKAHYDPPGGPDSLAVQAATVVVPAVQRVLADIKAKAPNAAVYFVDYPAISTDKASSPNPATYDAGSCFSAGFPFTAIDTPYLQQAQATLNTDIGTAVTGFGANFVDAYPQSLTHSACAGTADPWINGILPPPTPGSLHPNLEGAQHLAADALAAIGPRTAPTSAPPTTASSSASGSTSSTGSGSVSPAATSSSAIALASTGSHGVPGLTLAGSLLVLAGGGLVMGATRRRAARHR